MPAAQFGLAQGMPALRRGLPPWSPLPWPMKSARPPIRPIKNQAFTPTLTRRTNLVHSLGPPMRDAAARQALDFALAAGQERTARAIDAALVGRAAVAYIDQAIDRRTARDLMRQGKTRAEVTAALVERRGLSRASAYRRSAEALTREGPQLETPAGHAPGIDTPTHPKE